MIKNDAEFEEHRKKMATVKTTVNADEFAIIVVKVIDEMIEENELRAIVFDEFIELGARIATEMFGGNPKDLFQLAEVLKNIEEVEDESIDN